MKKLQLFSIVLSILFGCNTPQTPDKTPAESASNIVTLTPEQLSNIDFQTSTLEEKSISSILKVSGKIDVPPTNMVSVCVPMGGYLKSTKLLEGMHIRKGEVIAVMEDQEYIQLQQDYLTAKTNLSVLEKEFQRQQNLNANKTSSDKVFEKAQAEYLSQKILMKALSEKLLLININPDRLNESNISRTITIYAPIDGFVSSIKMNVGKFANPSDVLFELVNPSDIHLALTIFEKDIDKLFIGQKITAYTNHQPDKKYPCSIILIGQDISAERSVNVHCHFEQYDKTLIPGMYMNAELEITNNKAFVIPNDGLVRFEGKEYVFTVANNRQYEMHEVTTQNSEKDATQITFLNGTIDPKQVFVTKGAYTLLMQLKNKREE